MFRSMRKLCLILSINLVLFGATPFLNCGGNAPQEAAQEISQHDAGPGDSGTTGNNTPDTWSPPEQPAADLPQANTPYQPPQGAAMPQDAFEVKASGLAVPPSQEEKLVCFVIAAPNQEDRLLHRFEPLIAKQGLVKRLSLNIDEGDQQKTAWDCSGDDFTKQKLTPVFVWMPGVESFQFPPKSGVLLKAGQKLRLILHVHNQTQQDIQAASGLKVYHLPKDGKVYRLWSNPITGFNIQAGKSQRTGNLCKLKQSIQLLAGLPMMGQYGVSYVSELIRPDGTREELMYVDDWSTQKHWRMYSFPYKAAKGDVLATTCTWRNTSQQEVKQGWRSTDEMCDLMVYTDASTSSTEELCDLEPTQPAYQPPPINYKPSECASKKALPTAKDVAMKTKLGSELDVDFGFTGGGLVEANWELQSGTVVFKSALIGNLLQKEHTMAAGQVRTGPTFHFDLVIQAVVNLGQKVVTYPFPISASGAFKKGTKPGSFSVDVTCGKFEHREMTYQITGDTLWIGGIVKAATQVGPIDYSLKLKFVKRE